MNGRRIVVFIVLIFAGLLSIISLLSLVHDVRLWYAKIIDFPRLQYLVAAVLLLSIILLLNRRWRTVQLMIVAGTCAAIVIHARVILPYYFGEKVVPDAPAATSNDLHVRVLIVNVLMENRNSEDLLAIIRETRPDLVLAMEVDDWWIARLEVLKNDHPHTVEVPLDNAYGMALYSKLPISEKDIMYLDKDSVPSFRILFGAQVGEWTFFGVHPVPPVPSEKYPDDVGDKEVALQKIGRMVAGLQMPVVVAGDLNDVSWSHTARLFERTGQLRNVRLGRGVYSSYDASSPILRWPLDHFFVTDGIAVASLERLPHFGSDHFPMLAELVIMDR